MPRRIPPAGSLPSIDGLKTQVENHRRESGLVLELNIRLITPLFGGGWRAGHVDEFTPISVKAIRGHLRFWWRATRGAQFETAEQLAERESLVFGDTERASPISLTVSALNAGAPVPVQEWRREFSKARDCKEWRAKWVEDLEPVVYALFPFQIDEKTRKQYRDEPAKPTDAVFRRCIPAASFGLKVTIAEGLQADVNAALWAWLNFGGLGSRTRRGLGSLWCDNPEFSPKIAATGADATELARWLADKLAAFGVDDLPTPRPWPTLGRSGYFAGSAASHMEAWQAVVQCLFQFRQGGVGRNRGGTNRAGRSFWPEPESIRAATGQRLNRGPGKYHPPEPDERPLAFPRAEFGLPIVFHFKDSHDSDPNADPRQTELYPVADGVRHKRMGSPLIVKPLAVGPDRSVPLIVRLAVPPLDEADLVQKADDKLPLVHATAGHIRSSTLKNYANSPLGPAANPRSASGSAIEAFLAFIENECNGFARIRLP